jgi:hypothetical protein
MNELVQGLTQRLHASGERMLATLLGYFAVLLLLAFAFAAFVYAAATALTSVYGPVVSALIIAGASLVLALIVLAWLAHRRRKLRREMRLRRAAQPAQPITAGLASTILPIMVRTSPFGTLLVVAATAYMLQRANQRRGR